MDFSSRIFGTLALGICLAAVASPFRASQASDWRTVRWTTAEGLPQNSVNDVLAQANGDVWLATFGGLARFDGQRFEVVDLASDPGLESNRITSLAPQSPDAFWFVTQRGALAQYRDGRARTLVAPQGPGLELLRVVPHPGRGFAAVGLRGALWWSDGQRPWRQVRGPGQSGGFNVLATTQTGEVWAVSGAALQRLAADGVIEPASMLPGEARTIAPRAGRGLWVGFAAGVAAWVDGHLEPLEVRPPMTAPVTAIVDAGPDALWVGSTAGLSRLERAADGGWNRIEVDLDADRPLRVRDLELDSRGALWVGTLGGGLFRVNRHPVELLALTPHRSEVSGLADDGRGGAWVVAGCEGLFHLDSDGASVPVRLPSAGAGCDFAFASGGSGAVWLRARQRIFQLDAAKGAAREIADALPDEPGPILASGDGSIWVVSRGGAVQRISLQGEPLEKRQLPAPLVGAAVAPDRALWIGGDGELFRVRHGTVDRFGAAQGIPRGELRDLLFRPGGEAWMGSYGGGIARLRGGTAAPVTSGQGLPDNSVSRLIEDGQGRLWIATNRGLAVAEWTELEAVVEGRTDALHPVVFGNERGFPEASFGSPAGFADRKGRLWLATTEGVARIEAHAFPFSPLPPQVSIDRISWASGAIRPGERIDLPPLVDRVRFDFSVHGALYPERLRFRYRIEGVHHDWIEVGAQPFGGWNPAGPGRRRLLVEARNEDGIWSAAPVVVELDVQPAWWQSGLFRAVLLLAGFAAIAATVHLGHRAVERRHAARWALLEERRRGEARAAELRAQLEHVGRVALAGELATSLAHEVNQPLTAIVSGAQTGRRFLDYYLEQPAELAQILDEIAAQGLRASQVIRELRRFLRGGGESTERLDLSELVRETLPLLRRELEQHRVRVTLDLDGHLPALEASRTQLEQVLLNLVMNACEALARSAASPEISISTRASGALVELAVGDNGPGLDAGVAERLFEPFVTTKTEGMGMGLAICRSIAEAHGGKLWVEAPEPGGARFHLALPALLEKEAAE